MRTQSRIAATVAALLPLACLLLWANHLANPLPAGTSSDCILIEKSSRKMTLLKDGYPLKEYHVALGLNPTGDKLKEGDKRTPEGSFVIDGKKLNSSFHLALHISYPDQKHVDAARALNVSPGGDIMIHGIRNGLGWIGRLHRLIDWTAGCIAVTDAEIDEINRAVTNGTTVEIRP